MSRASTTTPKQAAVTTTPQATPMSVPLDKVAKLAYEKWMKGGCKHGCDVQHWVEAEAELRAEMMKSSKK